MLTVHLGFNLLGVDVFRFIGFHFSGVHKRLKKNFLQILG